MKYRKGLLLAGIEKAITEIALEIQERYDVEFEQLGCEKNHIHILCSFHSKYSISEVVRIFKSITVRELFKKFEGLKKELWGGEFWADGFYASTVGEKGNWQVVEKYIRNQGKDPNIDQLHLF